MFLDVSEEWIGLGGAIKTECGGNRGAIAMSMSRDDGALD